MKKFQHVHIAMFGILFLGLLFTIYFALSSFQTMLKTSKEDSSIPHSIPTIIESKTPYNIGNYQAVTNLIDNSISGVVIEATANQISIKSSNIENELITRNLAMTFLSLDKNLYIDSMCGSVTSTCTSQSIEIIIKGEKFMASIKESDIK